jgi:hypothetical protein
MPKVPPPATPEGYFIPTLNQTGFMSGWVSDEVMKDFISFSPQAPGPVLDVGAAFGVATIPALAAGATVYANDLSHDHLAALVEQAGSELRSRLVLFPGRFPVDLKISEDELGAILIARVLHFFTGNEIEAAFAWCFQRLRVGGRLYVTAETPYLRNVQSFIPEYERRRASDARWPGFIDDFPQWDSRRGVNLPKQMHLLDEAVLAREASRAGFRVLHAEKFGRPEFPAELRLDGRESVGVIAERP